MYTDNDKLIIKDFKNYLPEVKSWIYNRLDQYSSQAKCVADLNFPRLPQYFSKELLDSAKVVYIDDPPKIPLSSMGLDQFQEFEKMELAGITYDDTFFIRYPLSENESLHFHELVHVVQWRYLGFDRFLLLYGLERLKNKYQNSFFEVMARQLQSEFESNIKPFDAESVVKSELEKKTSQFLNEI